MNVELVNKVTHQLVKDGTRIFQIHRFGADDVMHVGKLLSWANFELDSKIADLGCGTGEVSKIMRSMRRDLEFTLINISEAQLDYCPNYEKLHCSFLDVPLRDGHFDAAMFCFSIGHEDILSGLKEARRIVKDGGIVFIYDMVRTGGSNESMKEVEYVVVPEHEFLRLVIDAGFRKCSYSSPEEYGRYGDHILGDSYQQIFNGTKPAIWRLTK